MNEKYNVEAADDIGVAKRTRLLGSCRLTIALVGFFMFFHLYAQRIGMSVAIVCMVNHTAVFAQSSEAINASLETDLSSNTSKVEDARCALSNDSVTTDGRFVWSKVTQGHILGSFFYGYLVSQIPGGLLAEHFGGKWVLIGFLGLSSVATLLTPPAAYASVGLLIFLRILAGVGSGALFPAMHAFLGQWAPPLERSIICGLTYAGAMMGNVVALPMSGLLCQYGFAEGWGSIFYLIGTTSILTIIIWALITSNSPAQHPRISEAEKRYIMSSLKGEVSDKKAGFFSAPWLKFITSGPVWAIIIGNFATDWGLYTYLTNIPTFYKEILKFNIQSNGFFSALPFVGLWLTMTVCPMVADNLRSRNILSTVVTRKVFNSIGLFGAGIFLIALSYLDCTQTKLAVCLLTLAVTISGFVYSGYFVNHMDIAPQYAGTLMGISNGLSASAGFIAPAIAAALTADGSRESWQIVFFIAAGVYAAGGVLFCILASGEVQPWARNNQIEDANDMKVVEVILPNEGPIYKPKLAEDSKPSDPMLAKSG